MLKKLSQISEIYPFIFGVYPIANIYATFLYRLDLISAGFMAMYFIINGVISYLIYLLFKKTTSSSHLSKLLLVSLIGVVVISDFLLRTKLGLKNSFIITVVLFVFWLTVFLYRKKINGKIVINFNNSAKILVLTLYAFLFVKGVSNGWHKITIKEEEFLTDTFSSIEEFPQKEKETLPDIYYVILDAYGRDDLLRETCDYDNSHFIETLRGRGFVIPKLMTSNYPLTRDSLSSSLNMNYHENLAKVPVQKSNEVLAFKVKKNLISNNLVKKILSEYGYEYRQYLTWCEFTGTNKYADETLGGCERSSMFTQGLFFSKGFLSKAYKIYPFKTTIEKITTGAFQGIGEDLRRGVTGAPKFTFCHIISPHWPFTYGENGSRSPQDRVKKGIKSLLADDTKEDTEQYVEQLRYINKMILEMLDKKSLGYEPIIIFQSDHSAGPMLDWTSSYANSPEGKAKSFPIFSAYYFPDGFKEKIHLYDGITPINVMRVIVSRVTGVRLDLLEDRNYYTNYEDSTVNEDLTFLIKGKKFQKKEK